MSFYEKVIHEATGLTDPKDLRAVEDCMRDVVFHSTLDWQTREQLEQGARDAVVVLKAVGKL